MNYSSVALEKIPEAIVEANSLLVDSISGATVTSAAIVSAVREALTEAGLDPASFEKIRVYLGGFGFILENPGSCKRSRLPGSAVLSAV